MRLAALLLFGAALLPTQTAQWQGQDPFGFTSLRPGLQVTSTWPGPTQERLLLSPWAPRGSVGSGLVTITCHGGTLFGGHSAAQWQGPIQEPINPTDYDFVYDFVPIKHGPNPSIGIIPTCGNISIGNVAVVITCKGEVIFGPGITPSECARQFAEALKRVWPEIYLPCKEPSK